MKSTQLRRSLYIAWLLAFAAAFSSARAIAHCDAIDGPVVKAAQRSLAERNVNLVLIWVQKADEAEIKRAFDQTVAVRKLGPEAMELADRHFFETLVRLHRAGEGAPFTGLKPAGGNIGPAIAAADQALDTGEVEPLLRLLLSELRRRLQETFDAAASKKRFAANDVAAGRAYVEAYVRFIHYVEGVHEAVSTAPTHSEDKHVLHE